MVQNLVDHLELRPARLQEPSDQLLGRQFFGLGQILLLNVGAVDEEPAGGQLKLESLPSLLLQEHLWSEHLAIFVPLRD